jgi:hypothetical protein
MKLPNGDRAIVDIDKLRTYCLNPQHPRGRHKARVFASFGIREADAEELQAAIVAAAIDAEARLGAANPDGQRYNRRFRLRPQGQNGQNPQYLDCANRGRLTAINELLCIMRKRRLAMTGIEMHSVVALLGDLPEQGLVRGQVGTVVETWAPGVYEVEFCDDNGKTYAMVALKAEQLMRLYHEPVHQAA